MKRWMTALLACLLMAAALPALAQDSLVVTEEMIYSKPEENFYKVAGIIVNQGEEAIDISFVRVELKDEAGETLENTSNVVIPGHLAPGEIAYFAGSFMDISEDTLAAVASHTVTIEQEAYGVLVALPTVVITPLDQIDEEKGIVAEYTNNTGKPLKRVRVVWILRDESGKLIDLITFLTNFMEPLAKGAQSESGYPFGWMTPTLAECLDMGLANGSAQCLVFAIQE
ncbi:MAG: hypothetical protein GXZ04_05165 [Clostridiales bacterium]|nr:hypothetical protein [Clostridiales bacterium]